jgi:transposase
MASGVQPDAALAAGRLFETIVEDVRSLLREFAGRKGKPTAMILDSRTLQSTPESGARGGYDGAKRRKGSKVHAALDTLGHLRALHVTAADDQDRAQVDKLAGEVQKITQQSVELAYVDQGYTGEAAREAAAKHGIQLEVVKHTEAKCGFVLLSRRWVVERSFALPSCANLEYFSTRNSNRIHRGENLLILFARGMELPGVNSMYIILHRA